MMKFVGFVFVILISKSMAWSQPRFCGLALHGFAYPRDTVPLSKKNESLQSMKGPQRKTLSATHPFFKEIQAHFQNPLRENDLFFDVLSEPENDVGLSKTPDWTRRQSFKRNLLVLSDALELAWMGSETALNGWINSDQRAALVFSLLTAKGGEGAERIWKVLSLNNSYLSPRLWKTPLGAPLTFSFEKETRRIQTVARFYRIQGASGRDGVAKSTDELRRWMLNTLKYDPLKIESTPEKPPYLQRLDKDGDDVFEVRKKLFGFSLNSLFTEIKDLSQQLRETAGFHVHIAFEIPRDYPAARKFHVWLKHLNDFLVLRGLEEGRHSNRMSGILHWTQSMRSDYAVANVFWRFKFHGAALRSGLYGPAIHRPEEFSRIGIELRDAAKTLEDLQKITRQTAEGIRGFIWERDLRNDKEDRTTMLNDEPSPLHRDQLLTEIGNSDLREITYRVFEENPDLMIPLQCFEDLIYFDYSKGEGLMPTTEDQKLIRQSRAHYIRNIIKDIQKSEQELQAMAPEEQKEIIITLLQISLTDWARQTRISRFYRNF